MNKSRPNMRKSSHVFPWAISRLYSEAICHHDLHLRCLVGQYLVLFPIIYAFIYRLSNYS